MDIPKVLQGIDQKLKFNIGQFTIEPQIWQVIIIVFLLFLLVITMASMRRHFLEWSVKGAGFGVILGFALAIILEGLLLVSGKTFLITVLGWKNAPKPIQQALDVGKDKFSEVLGASTTDSTVCPPGTKNK